MKRKSKSHLYWDNQAEEFKEVPDAPLYIVSTDTFMSGWGAAKGKVNRCIVPCPDAETALKVKSYVQSRTDQKNVRLVINKPGGKADAAVIYSLLNDWLETAKRKG